MSTALATPVPACPGWLVQDVVAHLAAVVEDALAGRLTGPPSEEQTAVQVARYKGRPMTQTLAEWTAGAPKFEEIISAFDVPQAVIDVASHEQDIRGALACPGRGTPRRSGGWAAGCLRGLRTPVPVRVTVEDAEFRGRRRRGWGGGGAVARGSGRPGTRRSGGGWAAAAGTSWRPLTGPVTRRRFSITSWSSGPARPTSSNNRDATAPRSRTGSVLNYRAVRARGVIVGHGGPGLAAGGVPRLR